MIKKKWPIVTFLPLFFLPLLSWGQSSIEKIQNTITIQVVSLKKIERAEQELARLKTHGLDAFMRHERVKDKGMWYRIYVGQFETREDATKFAQGIKGRGIISGFWVKRIEIAVEPSEASPSMADRHDGFGTNIDESSEKQAPPPVDVETPRTVAPTEEEPSPIHSQAATPTEQTPSRYQPPPEKPEGISTGKAREPATTDKKRTEPIFPPKDAYKTEPVSQAQAIAVQGPDKPVKSSRFSVGVKSSYFLASNTDNFKIKDTSGGNPYTWSFKSPKVYSSLVSAYRFNPATSIEAAIERAFFTKLDVWHVKMGPKFEFREVGGFTPYAKGSLVLGHLDWDDAPGDFDTAWGWEAGVGVSFTREKLQFGLETSYRAIKYDYNSPSRDGVTATDSQLDFSGVALSGTLHYRF
jgi:hypothetical protein